MAAFTYLQAEEIRDALKRHGVQYLFIGKSAAVLHGFPDTTQDTDLFVRRQRENGMALVAALRELGFVLTAEQCDEVVRGKDFVQLKNGPFDIDLVFAPTASRDSRTPIGAAWRSKASQCARSTTSSPARQRRTDRRTEIRCRGCGRSATISATAVEASR